MHVQCFLAHAAFTGFQELRSWSGAIPRHLDSWLMTPQHCRDTFASGTRGADVAVVVGRYQRLLPAWNGVRRRIAPCSHQSRLVHRSSSRRSSGQTSPRQRGQECVCSLSSGGYLESLCDWLNLTRLAVLDASFLNAGTDVVLPERVDGYLLVNLPESRASRAAVEVEALWGAPLFAGVGALVAQRPGEYRAGRANLALTYWDERRFLNVLEHSRSRMLPVASGNIEDFGGRITVALARDEAFHCYFAETLDALERRGARLVDFSPLHDEALPRGVDCVYLGCGDCSAYAAILAQNHCMKESLRIHLRRGGRIYAEGTGAAYLCRWIEVKPGCFIPGVGLLPASARRMPRHGDPSALRLHLRRGTWLGPAGTEVRGYRNWEWWFEPESLSSGLIAESGFEYDMMGDANVLGSLLHLDFAAQEHLLSAFFQTRPNRTHSFTGH